ncbi:MAG: hypothetical protein AAF800_07635 [Planctomycetota bacterium]
MRYLLPISMFTIGSMLIERGVYFYTTQIFHFESLCNLLLSLSYGMAYVVGAAVVAPRIGRNQLHHKAALVAAAIGVVAASIAAAGSASTIFLQFMAIGCLTGVMWPLLIGHTLGADTAVNSVARIGRFNLAWAFAVPPSIFLAGVVLDRWAPGLPLSAGLVLAACAAVIVFNRRHPRAQAGHHAEPQDSLSFVSVGTVWAGRWGVLMGYTLVFALIPLQPTVFRQAGYSPAEATKWAMLFDVFRLATFLVMTGHRGWYGRVAPVHIAVLLAPIGFFAAVAGPTIAWIAVGHAVLGVSAAFLYFAPLVHGLAGPTCSVRAGGYHEGAKGLALLAGPFLAVITLSVAENRLDHMARLIALPMLGLAVAGVALHLICWATLGRYGKPT